MTIPELRVWRRKLRGVLLGASTAGIQLRSKSISLSDLQSSYDSSSSSKIEVREEEQSDCPIPTTTIISESSSDWVITIKEKLDQLPPNNGWDCWLNHTIFKAPRNIREIDPKAYIPQVVSIGPYHHGKPRLQEMEKHKWRLLRHVLETRGHQVEPYLEAMAEIEAKTRKCYAKQMKVKDMGSQEFIEMMLLDACFILELINASVKGFIYCGYSWGDPIFTSRGVLPSIQRDLLMLENQIPLFVLERLFALTCDFPNESDDNDSVSQLALQFFSSVLPICEIQHYNNEEEIPNSSEPGLHLLHVVRQSLLPRYKPTFPCNPCHKQENKHRPQLMMYCVTRLRDSGVKFQKKKNSKTFMDIEFKNGVLYIPPLIIHDLTKSIFLNLMAFEQCYPHCSNHVTSYLSFMDGLISCPNDVGYLRYQGIIDHGLGSEEEVASLFNKFCREIAFDINDCYLSGVSDDVNRYFDRKWHRWRATLKREYFSNPWAIVSLLAAVLLIGLTFTQTFYSVFAYYIPLRK